MPLKYRTKAVKQAFQIQYLAYETMPADLLSRIAERELIHDHVHNSTGAVTPNWEEQDSPLETPGAHHPIVVHHHATDRKHLMLGRRPHALITGMELEESEALLDELLGARDPGEVRLEPRLEGGRPYRLGQLVYPAPPQSV